MSVLYVKEQGSCIQKRSERIVVTKGQMTLLEITAFRRYCHGSKDPVRIFVL